MKQFRPWWLFVVLVLGVLDILLQQYQFKPKIASAAGFVDDVQVHQTVQFADHTELYVDHIESDSRCVQGRPCNKTGEVVAIVFGTSGNNKERYVLSSRASATNYSVQVSARHRLAMIGVKPAATGTLRSQGKYHLRFHLANAQAVPS